MLRGFLEHRLFLDILAKTASKSNFEIGSDPKQKSPSTHQVTCKIRFKIGGHINSFETCSFKVLSSEELLQFRCEVVLVAMSMVSLNCTHLMKIIGSWSSGPMMSFQEILDSGPKLVVSTPLLLRGKLKLWSYRRKTSVQKCSTGLRTLSY